MTTISSHDDYIAAAAEQLRPLLHDLRKQLSDTLGSPEEVIAYNMPGFRIGETIVVGYAAFSKQCGIYVSSGAVKSLAEEISNAGLEATKTGVKFSPKKPIPDNLVKMLALASKNDHGL